MIDNGESSQESLRKALSNFLMDFLYKQIKTGATNEQINRRLKGKRMPKMEPDKLNGLREWFKQAEHHQPEKMAEFKKRLLGC